MSGAILFLAHRLPFPPDRGDKIRSHHILRHLARLAPVHVGCLADDEQDMAHEHELAQLAETHCLVRRTLPLPLAGLKALAGREAVSLAAFRHQRLARYVQETIARHDIRAIYVFSGQMGQYVPVDWRGRLIVDLGDVDSAKFEAYATDGRWPRNWIDAREGRLMRAEEQRLASRADHTLFVSDAEAALFLSRLDRGVGASVRSLSNGIDCAFFDPAKVQVHRELADSPGPQIVFTGQMDYPPNIAAAQRLAARLMPEIRKRHPEALCHIVGRNPTDGVRALDGRNGCRVWGTVPDVRPFLVGADLALVPLEIARGVQNKVLEAMAMELPVVLSQGAATGISGSSDVHFAIGTSDEDLIAHSLRLIGDRAAAKTMGQEARAFVEQRYSWAGTLAPLAGLLAMPPASGASRAAA